LANTGAQKECYQIQEADDVDGILEGKDIPDTTIFVPSCSAFKTTSSAQSLRCEVLLPKFFHGRHFHREMFRVISGWHVSITNCSNWDDKRFFHIHFWSFLVSIIPIAIIGGLTRFQPGASTSVQRGFTMAWLSVGIAFGLTLQDSFKEQWQMPELPKAGRVIGEENLPKQRQEEKTIGWPVKKYLLRLGKAISIFLVMLLGVVILGISFVPVIGGVVVVVQELLEYGSCTLS
jgi:hypothetical protein